MRVAKVFLTWKSLTPRGWILETIVKRAKFFIKLIPTQNSNLAKENKKNQKFIPSKFWDEIRTHDQSKFILKPTNLSLSFSNVNEILIKSLVCNWLDQKCIAISRVVNPNWFLGRNLKILPQILTFWPQIQQKTEEIHTKY
jgi:hypothetical protein